MTEDEAKQTTCPFLQATAPIMTVLFAMLASSEKSPLPEDFDPKKLIHCKASSCQMWRWLGDAQHRGRTPSGFPYTEGYCGLVGKFSA